MGKNSSIEWTHHTFNPWWGCAKVSEACRNCYAEAWSRRTGYSLWGQDAERRFFGQKHWNEPIKWNKEAAKERTRKRVFCASMADVFEDREDLAPWRSRLWVLIDDTPWLDWLLLTKRIHNLSTMNPWGSDWPRNVWLGTTIEDQDVAEERIPELLKYPASIRFISCEPLLGSVDLKYWLNSKGNGRTRIDWVIVGGESGHKARTMDPAWVCSIRDQCLASSTPFHFKQWGTWYPIENSSFSARRIAMESVHGTMARLAKIGKKKAGRQLDGKIWDQIP